MKVTPLQHNFIDIYVVDVDMPYTPGEPDGEIYTLPAIPRVGEMIELKEGNLQSSRAVEVTEVLYYTYNPTSPRRTYVSVFVKQKYTLEE